MSSSLPVARSILFLCLCAALGTGLIFLRSYPISSPATTDAQPPINIKPKTPFQKANYKKWLVLGLAGIEKGRFKQPRGITEWPNGGFVVGDRSGRVQCFDGTGKAVHEVKLKDHDRGNPRGIGVLPNGNVLLCDTHYSNLLEMTPAGTVVRTWGGPGKKPGEFAMPQACAVDVEAGVLYILEYGWYNDRIQKFTLDGTFIKTWGTYGDEPGQFMRGTGMTLDPQHNILVADSANHRIQKFDPEGNVLAVFGSVGAEAGQLMYPYDVAVAPDGKVYVAEFGNHRVSVFTSDGTFIKWLGGPGTEPGKFYAPWNLTVTSHGQLLVSDTGNHRIQILQVCAPKKEARVSMIHSKPITGTDSPALSKPSKKSSTETATGR